VRAEFGDNFVYRSGSEAQELRKSFDNLLATQNAQSQGLAAAISMLADKVASSEKLTKALINELAEARKPKQAELPLIES
jgi:hemoglobin-like flavoprotein